jgi:hypothetical protein
MADALARYEEQPSSPPGQTAKASGVRQLPVPRADAPAIAGRLRRPLHPALPSIAEIEGRDLRRHRAPPPSPPHPALPSVTEIDGRPPWTPPQPLRSVAVHSPPSPYPPTWPPPLYRGARRKVHGLSSVAGQSSDAAPSPPSRSSPEGRWPLLCCIRRLRDEREREMGDRADESNFFGQNSTSFKICAYI